METKFTILVGIIPIFNNKILITQRSLNSKFMPGAWGLPCGKIEYGEDLEDAVHRELKEETSLTCEILKLVGTSKFVGVKDGLQLHNTQINFLVNTKSSEVELDSSSNDFKWIEFSEIYNVGLDKFTTDTIKQADELINGVHHKSTFFKTLISDLDKLDWSNLEQCFKQLPIILKEHYEHTDKLKDELKSFSKGRFSETITCSHELPSHLKWFIYKSIKYGYSIWINEYKKNRLPGFANTIHNHRYWFSSLILKGAMDHNLHSVQYLNDGQFKEVLVADNRRINKGDVYTIAPDSIHSFNEISEGTVTLLIRSKAIKDHSTSFNVSTKEVVKHYSLQSRHDAFKTMLNDI